MMVGPRVAVWLVSPTSAQMSPSMMAV